MMIVPLDSADDADWLALRTALWRDATAAEHREEMAAFLVEPARYAQFLARDNLGRACGLVEVSLRSDYVNGTNTSPVAFLEGLYVRPRSRRQGVARALVGAAIAWAKDRGVYRAGL